MDDPVVGFGMGKLNPGVEMEPVAAGDANPSGVEACSVANRSGVGEEARGYLHPINKKRREIIKKSFRLLISQFNGLKIKFFTR
jgi:hypothetical protein